MKKVGVVTTSRSDYSSLLPILQIIQKDSDFDLQIFASGMHLAPEFGHTVDEIVSDGFEVTDRIEMLLASDTPRSIAKSIGIGTLGFGESLERLQPDVLLMVGDRTELLAPVVVALVLAIPVAHISGGDITEGAVDNQVRHAVTKMSHLHFVAMEEHATRLIQMGEESWRIHTTGDPALDFLRAMKLLKRDELSKQLNMSLIPPLIVVTFHPVTLGNINPLSEVNNLLDALKTVQGTMVFSFPNADSQNRVILERIQDFVNERPNAGLFSSLGQLKYYSLLALADIMVGNSSSGIWEAPSFQLPVVNIGDRQKGRLRAKNVIDVSGQSDAIRVAINQGLSMTFQTSLKDLVNPYGDGRAAQRVVDVLKKTNFNAQVLQKKFVDLSIDMSRVG